MNINTDIEIVKFQYKYAAAFRDLNLEWISKYFKIEDSDIAVLNNPQESIINKGGEIFIALYKGSSVGACALVQSKNPNYDYELAKLAVSPKAQGLKLGLYLCEAIIAEARKKGGKSLFLETNSTLIPAITLYKKLGFKEIPMANSAYERVDLIMCLEL